MYCMCGNSLAYSTHIYDLRDAADHSRYAWVESESKMRCHAGSGSQVRREHPNHLMVLVLLLRRRLDPVRRGYVRGTIVVRFARTGDGDNHR